MLEFTFFHEQPRSLFVTFLEELGQSPQLRTDGEELVVLVEEHLDDALDEQIEAYYEQLLEMNEQLFLDEQQEQQVHVSGVTVSLSDGRTVYAVVRPALLRRVLENLTPQELGELVAAVADAVEHPDERPICKRA